MWFLLLYCILILGICASYVFLARLQGFVKGHHHEHVSLVLLANIEVAIDWLDLFKPHVNSSATHLHVVVYAAGYLHTTQDSADIIIRRGIAPTDPRLGSINARSSQTRPIDYEPTALFPTPFGNEWEEDRTIQNLDLMYPPYRVTFTIWANNYDIRASMRWRRFIYTG
ncbi:uncharacterized protein BDZ99DRAFT_477199 [Mytilinidion resinicola]|uniref:Uncharacterized protein n=1 Tax=Mytilinidion resinicola TaxID=574789 RepID=A0A6A6YM19_9PEZI|nr:uncharacterized protein BDZ99DRAFT_477199 [Mytilinidion resinicola]KAF2809840.1 hypothetical protein BDZ99DRAFT_477199 [Mytilinidion resinicola]